VTDAATAARYNVRPLLPGPQEALRDAVLRLGLPADRLTALATHGAVEALAVQGLSADLTRVLAVLDWELSTLGHPLADFSYHCMSWHIKPGPSHASRGIGGLDHASLGIPDEKAYVRRYCERTGRADPDLVMADWNFYLAYNLFRIAGILQGIAKRVEAGTASSEQARQSAAGARPLAEMGWQIARQS